MRCFLRKKIMPTGKNFCYHRSRKISTLQFFMQIVQIYDFWLWQELYFKLRFRILFCIYCLCWMNTIHIKAVLLRVLAFPYLWSYIQTFLSLILCFEFVIVFVFVLHLYFSAFLCFCLTAGRIRRLCHWISPLLSLTSAWSCPFCTI